MQPKLLVGGSNMAAVKDDLHLSGPGPISFSNAVMAVREPPPSIEPRDMGELRTLAQDAGKTGFFGARSPEQALLVMMAGRDLGFSYTQSLRAFDVIVDERNNKTTLSLRADAMVGAVLMRRDACAYFRTLEATAEKATVETQRIGYEPQQYTFALADAQRAGLTGKQNWQKYPSRMLLARARAALARD